MVITTACFVGGDTCIKLIGTTLPLGEIICLVGLLSTVFLFLICAQQGVLESVPMIFTRTVLLRSMFDVLGSFMFVSALMHMPLANLSAVMQSVPLVVVVVAVIFLGEKAGLARSAAVIAGFVGVLFIVKPSLQTITVYEFLAVGAVVVVALRDLVTKRIPAQCSPPHHRSRKCGFCFAEWFWLWSGTGLSRYRSLAIGFACGGRPVCDVRLLLYRGYRAFG